MNFILFGFKSCGKTTYGKLLAEKLERPFIDTDEIIRTLFKEEQNEDLTPREIYQKLGEEAFRALETRAVKMLEQEKDAVIAVGGGTLLNPEHVQMVQKIGRLIYLEASPEVLRKRILREDLPAFLTGEEELTELMRIRLPIYEAIDAKRINIEILDDAAVISALRSIVLLDAMDFFPQFE